MRVFSFDVFDQKTNEAYGLKVSIRPEASDLSEARINFELNFDNLPEGDSLRQAFQQTTEWSGSSGKKKRTVSNSVIRFGFDLDSSTNPPIFSFDMGRDAYDSVDMRRTGDVLGRILSKITSDGHHQQDFAESLSNPENFKKIAEAFVTYFEHVPLATLAEAA